MSNILAAYTSIANMEVGSVKSRNIDRINLTVKDSDLPMRLLMPSTEGDQNFVGIGSLQKVTWAIQDLCLFASVTKGAGIQQYSEAMVEYIVLYLAQVKANKNPATNCCITGMSIEMTPVRWGETKTYWAVDINLVVEETL